MPPHGCKPDACAVQRAVRVLDGAVALFDGVAGVEAQTETVWEQAERFTVPRIGFVNKLDRVGASFQHAIDSIERRLVTTPIPLQWPSAWLARPPCAPEADLSRVTSRRGRRVSRCCGLGHE